MLGSMSLIWCHLIWLVALVISLERTRSHHLVVKKAEKTFEKLEKEASKVIKEEEKLTNGFLKKVLRNPFK